MQNEKLKRKSVRWRVAQSTAEYFLIMCVVVAAIVAGNFIGKVKFNLSTYFTKATAKMGNGATPPTPVTDTCESILSNVTSLENQISELNSAVATVNTEIADLEARLPEMKDHADQLGAIAASNEAQASSWRAQEAWNRQQAADTQLQVDALQKEYDDYCVTCMFGCYDPDSCTSIQMQITSLQSMVSSYLSQADYDASMAVPFENRASDQREAEKALRDGILQINTDLPDLRKQRDDYVDAIADKQREINEYKLTHSECFPPS